MTADFSVASRVWLCAVLFSFAGCDAGATCGEGTEEVDRECVASRANGEHDEPGTEPEEGSSSDASDPSTEGASGEPPDSADEHQAMADGGSAPAESELKTGNPLASDAGSTGQADGDLATCEERGIHCPEGMLCGPKDPPFHCVECLSDADCSAGVSCVDNVCERPCESGLDCSQLAYCDSTAGHCKQLVVCADWVPAPMRTVCPPEADCAPGDEFCKEFGCEPDIGEPGAVVHTYKVHDLPIWCEGDTATDKRFGGDQEIRVSFSKLSSMALVWVEVDKGIPDPTIGINSGRVTIYEGSETLYTPSIHSDSKTNIIRFQTPTSYRFQRVYTRPLHRGFQIFIESGGVRAYLTRRQLGARFPETPVEPGIEDSDQCSHWAIPACHLFDVGADCDCVGECPRKSGRKCVPPPEGRTSSKRGVCVQDLSNVDEVEKYGAEFEVCDN